MSPEVIDLQAAVLAEVGDLMDVIEREGADYARQCALWVIESRSGRNGPNIPAGLPRPIAVWIRDAAIEQALFRDHPLPMGAR